MILRSLVIGLLALGSFAFGTLQAQAISLNPPIFEFVLSPGDSIDDVIKIFNDTQSPLSLTPEKVNFTAKADDEFSGAPEFYSLDETRTGRELAPWIIVDGTSSELEPLTRKDLPFSITVPENASPGSYFGGIILRSGEKVEQGVGLVTGTAVLVLVKVTGEVLEEAQLTDFNVAGGLMTHLPVSFEARIVNSGTVHLQPTGSIEVRSMFGKTSGALLVNPELRSVLPESARRYSSSWGQEFKEGTSEFMKQWNGFAFGRYTATLDLKYGADGKSLQASQSFWIIPWMAIGGFIAGMIMLIFGIKGFFKWYTKRILAKHNKGEL